MRKQESDKIEAVSAVEGIVSTLEDIPNTAFQPESDICRLPIVEWWCPDCGAHEEDEADFIEDWRNGLCYETGAKRVNYCCKECFEENIYVITD